MKNIDKVFQYFFSRFKRKSRSERERLMCAMIRVNYGTAWTGDIEILKSFFPESAHKLFMTSGLTSIIDALSPFSDEPTEAGLPTEDHTLFDDIGRVIRTGENTSSLSLEEVTTDLPLISPEESTHTITIKDF